MLIVKCNSILCKYNKKGICEGFLGKLIIDADEFNNDSSCPPICITAEIIEE